jgi:DNA segregation ATPase FtsK/SpoIIIE-like protein
VPFTGPDLDQARDLLKQRHRESGKLMGCTSYIQRHMQIYYYYAAEIMEHLEADFITEADHNGERFFR